MEVEEQGPMSDTHARAVDRSTMTLKDLSMWFKTRCDEYVTKASLAYSPTCKKCLADIERDRKTTKRLL